MRFTSLLSASSLGEFLGQKHFIGKDKPLYKLIKKKDIPHLFFYGRPGTGKTSLAKIIAKELDFDFYSLNATSLKVEDLRAIFKRHQNSLMKPLIFIDEIHRMSKNQQEVLLPIMERFEAIIIGASTENPYFTLSDALRSRAFIYEFKSLEDEELKELCQRAKKEFDLTYEDGISDYLCAYAKGDARAMLNLLDFASHLSKEITIKNLKELQIQNQAQGLGSKDTHYDLASAMIKSLRGSDIDASLYYLARLIVGNEDISFITRRLVIFSSEDIGNANPNALNLANACMQTCQKIGYPEARIILAQTVVYLASSPKSNSSYLAINKAIQNVKSAKLLDIPKHLKTNNPTYKYPHDFGGFVSQDYLSEKLSFYESKSIAFEQTLDAWILKIKGN